jgi:hypothetical protein
MAENTTGRITRINPAAQVARQNTAQVNETPQEKQIAIATAPKQNDFRSLTGGAYEPVLITETCHLPSRGLLYGSALGSTIEFRAMTTLEERMRLSGENFWSTMAAILNRCKVNTDFDIKNMVDFDFFAALVKLRIISYGNNYKTQSKCFVCGKQQEVNVNLDECKVTELPDDFVEPFVIGPLPVSGDVLECRFLRVFDYIDIHEKVTDWKRKHPKDTLNNPEYTLLMEHAIVTVNGVALNEFQKKAYVEKMVGADSTFYHDEYQELFFGLHRIGTSTCEETDCGSAIIYEIAPSDSFFRATPLDNKRGKSENAEVQQDS